MSERMVITVAGLESKSGEKDGRQWTKHSLKDSAGNWYSTFDSSVIAPAVVGEKASIEFEISGKFRNLVSVTPVDVTEFPGNGPAVQTEAAFRARTADGAPDWDVKDLRINRCAYWKELLGPAMQAGIAVWRTTHAAGTTTDLANFVRLYGRQLRQIAEADTYSSKAPAAADEDIPF